MGFTVKNQYYYLKINVPTHVNIEIHTKLIGCGNTLKIRDLLK